MRTLVISDLHLGVGRRHAVLEWPLPRERLLRALGDVERLVLLGDTIELIGRSAAHSSLVAEPLLRAVGARLPAGAEVIIVPGNHDHALIEPWLRSAAGSLTVDAAVPHDASPTLLQLTRWLGGDRVRVHYPGVWLDEATWATHGHYLDRHLLPDSSYGVARGLLGRLPRDGARPEDYERAGGPSVSRLQRLMPDALMPLLELARAATMPVPAAPGRLLSPRLAPLTAPVLGLQLRRASLPALARVVHRLGVEADTVLFGHVHRLGPLPGDEDSDWTDPTGAVRLLNCGSWVYEPLLLHRASPPHPYWPGGAIVLEPGAAPRLVGLLDDLALEDMHGLLTRRRTPRR